VLHTVCVTEAYLTSTRHAAWALEHQTRFKLHYRYRHAIAARLRIHHLHTALSHLCLGDYYFNKYVRVHPAATHTVTLLMCNGKYIPTFSKSLRLIGECMVTARSCIVFKPLNLRAEHCFQTHLLASPATAARPASRADSPPADLPTST
jgi:hypothetical protein